MISNVLACLLGAFLGVGFNILTKDTKWGRRRQFKKAVRILAWEARYHTRAGHRMVFVAVNEANLEMRCEACPDLQPYRVGSGRRSWGI